MDAAIIIIPMLVMYIVGIYVGRHWDYWNSED